MMDDMGIKIRRHRGHLEYDIHTRGPDGQPVRERRQAPPGITSPTELRRYARQRAGALALGTPEVPAEVPTFAEFAAEWITACEADRLKPATLDAYRRRLRLHVLPALGKLRLNEVDDAALSALKLKMANASAKTVNDAIGVVTAVLTLAERRKVLDKLPNLDRVAPDEDAEDVEFYDFAEWERLVEGAERAGPMVLVAVLLAGEAGLRRGEIVALEQTDCDRTHVTVRRNEWQETAARRFVGSPKSRKARRIPMTARLKAAIAKVRHLAGKRLLRQADGRAVSLTTIQSWNEMACRRAGLPESRKIHKMRHTFCSHCAMRGVPVRTLQSWAGHADISTTMRYMHLSPVADEAIKLLEQAAPEGAKKEAHDG